jgi:hypothetical protein
VARQLLLKVVPNVKVVIEDHRRQYATRGLNLHLAAAFNNSTFTIHSHIAPETSGLATYIASIHYGDDFLSCREIFDYGITHNSPTLTFGT